MAEAKFYRAASGKILAVVCEQDEAALDLEGLELLVAGSTDAAQEKHVPVVEHVDGVLSVNVGGVDHPMTEEHYIQWVALVTEDTVTIKKLSWTDKPHANFADVEHGTVYEYCNLHGLWKTEF